MDTDAGGDWHMHELPVEMTVNGRPSKASSNPG